MQFVLTRSATHLIHAFVETKADTISGRFQLHLAATHFHAKTLHTFPLLFPLLLRAFHASISLFMFISNSSSVSASSQSMWQAVCLEKPSPPSLATSLQSCLPSDVSQGENLWFPSSFFFFPLPPDAYFCVEFCCFPVLCPPAPRVLYI